MALVDPCLYLQADAHPARTFRQLITAMLAEGILGSTSFQVTQRSAGANFSVDVAAGMGVVKGDAATQQGHYLVVNDATVNDSTTAVTSAPSAGNERYDRVILEVQDNAEDASGQNRPRFRVVAGTPAAVGTAVAPALPNTAITLAVIGPILNSTTTITNSLITDGRSASSLAYPVVNSASIVDANVTTAKIADGAVTSAKILDGTIAAGDLATSVINEGWTNLAFASGWATPSSSGQRVRYKKVANTVFVYGGMIRTGASGTATMGTLPAGYRPPAHFDAVTVGGLGGEGVRVRVDTDGVITAYLTETDEIRWLNLVFGTS